MGGCVLHTLRNLAGDQSITLADVIAGGNCVDDDIRFPLWSGLLEPLMRTDEEFISFNPTLVVSEHLRHVRLSVRVVRGTSHEDHVTALVRADNDTGPLHFRHYDAAAPQHVRLTLQETSIDCTLMAIVAKHSPLQQALMEMGWKPGQGARRQRGEACYRQQRRAV